MRKGLKSKYIVFILSLFMMVGVFLPRGGALAEETAKKADKYTIDLNVNINDSDELDKIKDSIVIKPSGRQVKVYKLKVDKEMSDDARLKLANTYDGKTIAETEKDLKEQIEKVVEPDESKLYYENKLYDQIEPEAVKGFDIKKLSELIRISDLDAGYYLIKETDASKQKKDKKLTTQVVKLPGESMTDNTLSINAKVSKTVPNDRIVLIKEDIDNSNIKLNQVEFELYRKDKDGDKVVTVDGQTGSYIYKDKGKTSSLITNDDGKIVVEDLLEGTYYFKEKTPHPGYDNSNIGNKSDDVSPGGTVTVKNKITPILRKANAKKEDEYLKEAKFKVLTEDNKALKFKKTGIYYEQDSNGKEEVVTDNNGAIYISDLKPGKYYLVETEAPEGFIKSDKKIELNIKDFRYVNKKGELDVLIVGNEPITPPGTPENPKGGYHFVKIDSSKKENRLAGAKFVLMVKEGDSFKEFLKDGKRVTLTSPSNGEFSIAGLPYEGDGTEYALKEIEAPKNHTISQELTPFTVNAASNSLPAKKIVNEPYVPTTVTSKENTITTRHVPGEITRVVKNPLVKTGDIRIVIMAIVGIILTIMGIRFVNASERKQRI